MTRTAGAAGLVQLAPIAMLSLVFWPGTLVLALRLERWDTTEPRQRLR